MTQRKDCPFCRIMRGETAVNRVYEDENLLGFFDVAPLTKGHIVLATKAHYPAFPAVPEELQGVLMRTASRLAVAVMRATDSDGFNLMVANGTCAGQLVAHAHVMIVPRQLDDGLVMPARTVPFTGEEQHLLLTKMQQRLKRCRREEQPHDS